MLRDAPDDMDWTAAAVLLKHKNARAFGESRVVLDQGRSMATRHPISEENSIGCEFPKPM